MNCPNCRCRKCKSYYRNPAPWGASAWASHMDVSPVANDGPATSLETSMTKHFLGPMRNPYESTISRMYRLYHEYAATPTWELYDRLMRTIARTGEPAEYFFKNGIQPPPTPRRNPWIH